MPVFRFVVCVTVFVAEASNTIDHCEPFHSIMSFSLAIKSLPFEFFQASGPSVFSVEPILPNSNIRKPVVFRSVGLTVLGSII